MMGAHESTLVSNALAVACAKVQAEGKIDVGISKSVRLNCSLTSGKS